MDDLKLTRVDIQPRGKETDLVLQLEGRPALVHAMTIDVMVGLWKALWSNLSARIPRNTAHLVEFDGADAAVGVRAATGQVFLTLRPYGLAPVSFLLDPNGAEDLAKLLSQAATSAGGRKRTKH